MHIDTHSVTYLMHAKITHSTYIISSSTMCYNYNVNYCTFSKEGPWAVHLTLGQDWGGGPIFKVSVSRLYAKECLGKLPTL